MQATRCNCHPLHGSHFIIDALAARTARCHQFRFMQTHILQAHAITPNWNVSQHALHVTALPNHDHHVIADPFWQFAQVVALFAVLPVGVAQALATTCLSLAHEHIIRVENAPHRA
eukprot:CAMPEP_0183358044 /NCGR_PEP_ID=MMETSP0164_2-20130417/48049_1 /TAXON_ID=221442 /ORGANISM="Coccolithus pelagicus ssp braarudi, Strain PLY182g" /LENGTH=115 /DNA_ID=CAMNT_0025531841 /DNA_START=205 /DNA_END=552 /DNA_ORIENTATION=+